MVKGTLEGVVQDHKQTKLNCVDNGSLSFYVNFHDWLSLGKGPFDTRDRRLHIEIKDDSILYSSTLPTDGVEKLADRLKKTDATLYFDVITTNQIEMLEGEEHARTPMKMSHIEFRTKVDPRAVTKVAAEFDNAYRDVYLGGDTPVAAAADRGESSVRDKDPPEIMFEE